MSEVMQADGIAQDGENVAVTRKGKTVTYRRVSELHGVALIRREDVNVGTDYQWGVRHDKKGATATNWVAKFGDDAIVGATISSRGKLTLEYSFAQLDAIHAVQQATKGQDAASGAASMVDYLRSLGATIELPDGFNVGMPSNGADVDGNDGDEDDS